MKSGRQVIDKPDNVFAANRPELVTFPYAGINKSLEYTGNTLTLQTPLSALTASSPASTSSHSSGSVYARSLVNSGKGFDIIKDDSSYVATDILKLTPSGGTFVTGTTESAQTGQFHKSQEADMRSDTSSGTSSLMEFNLS